MSRRPAMFDIFKSKQKPDAKKQPSIMQQVKAAVQVILSVHLLAAVTFFFLYIICLLKVFLYNADYFLLKPIISEIA